MGTTFLQINTPVRKGRKSKWGIDYYSPWDLLPDGKRKRIKRFFETKEERDAEIDRLNEKFARHGASAATELTPVELEDYRAARAMLPADVTLTAAARWYVANRRPEAEKKPLSEIFSAYLDALMARGVSAAQQTNSRKAISLFLSFMPPECDLADATTDRIRAWMKHLEGTPKNPGYADETRNNLRRWLFGAFEWAVGEGHIETNPVARVEVPKVYRTAPPYWTVPETRAILAYATLHDPYLLPFIVLRLFAGVRGLEIVRMTGQEIDRKRRIIDLPGFRKDEDTGKPVRVTKSGKRRIIQDAPPVLWEWLSRCPILESNNHIERLRAVRIGAGVPLKRNAYRHSFATYHVTLSGNANLTMLILGQEEDSRAFYDHYRNHVLKEDAVQYMELTPEAVLPWAAPVPRNLTATALGGSEAAGA